MADELSFVEVLFKILYQLIVWKSSAKDVKDTGAFVAMYGLFGVFVQFTYDTLWIVYWDEPGC